MFELLSKCSETLACGKTVWLFSLSMLSILYNCKTKNWLQHTGESVIVHWPRHKNFFSIDKTFVSFPPPLNPRKFSIFHFSLFLYYYYYFHGLIFFSRFDEWRNTHWRHTDCKLCMQFRCVVSGVFNWQSYGPKWKYRVVSHAFCMCVTLEVYVQWENILSPPHVVKSKIYQKMKHQSIILSHNNICRLAMQLILSEYLIFFVVSLWM